MKTQEAPRLLDIDDRDVYGRPVRQYIPLGLRIPGKAFGEAISEAIAAGARVAERRGLVWGGEFYEGSQLLVQWVSPEAARDAHNSPNDPIRTLRLKRWWSRDWQRHRMVTLKDGNADVAHLARSHEHYCWVFGRHEYIREGGWMVGPFLGRKRVLGIPIPWLGEVRISHAPPADLRENMA